MYFHVRDIYGGTDTTEKIRERLTAGRGGGEKCNKAGGWQMSQFSDKRKVTSGFSTCATDRGGKRRKERTSERERRDRGNEAAVNESFNAFADYLTYCQDDNCGSNERKTLCDRCSSC